ncbi:anti-sigma factor domain-containing protein [Effusibacillus pohliae]|uniref:anti-sigma factor domain-containing protein n=1 Tax=Effusibacillus pohliae TaxID=232270 RepID=UPI00035CEFD1|nr:anti-sigma factor domain-containing protein [Effusibacillus pohliae]
MQKQKGVIMKLTGSHAIILTPDRQFLRIPLQDGMQIGQEVEYPNLPAKLSVAWRKIGLLAASLALTIGIWQSMSWLRTEQVFAYVAIDINPSFELAVDKEKEVVQATPLNADAEKLIAHLRLKGKPIETAVNELAAEAAKQGFVKPDGEILVTASNAGTVQFDIAGLEQTVISSVRETLKQKGMAARVGGVLVSDSVREEAKALGLSPGKYAVYLQAKASGLEISLDDLKQESVSSVAVKHGAGIEELVRNMTGDKMLEELLKEQEQKAKAATRQPGDAANPNPASGKGSQGNHLLPKPQLPRIIHRETDKEKEKSKDGEQKDEHKKGDKKSDDKSDDKKKDKDKKGDKETGSNIFRLVIPFPSLLDLDGKKQGGQE